MAAAASDREIVLVDCPDEVGLIHRITGVLGGRRLNIESNHEFVDTAAGHFFFRAEVQPVDGPVPSAAVEAELSRVLPAAELVDEALKVAAQIADLSTPIVMMTKESVNRSYETTLAEGIRFERRVFQAMFATADQKEGMGAFVEKRKPAFTHR